MAISQHATGTQTTVLNTEHTLNTTSPDTTSGVYQLYVDTAVMIMGDFVEIRIKEKVISGGTSRVVWMSGLANIQDQPAVASPALILMHGWDMTIKQTGGTVHAYPWSIRKLL